MTISTEVRKAGPFIGNDSASVFPFAFKVFKAADLIVVRRQDNIDEETTLVLDSDYHVTLNSNQDTTPGGVVTLVAGALASGFTLVVSSELPYLQPTDLTNQGGFYPKVITNALDRLTIFCQQLAEITGRTLKLPITAPTNISTEIPLPNPAELIAWDETGTKLTTVSPQSLVTSIAYGSATADLFAGDGVTTTFPLSTNPASVNNLDVSVGGFSQRPVQEGIGDYSWNGGATITFVEPPPAPTVPGDKNVLVRYMQAIPVSDSEALHAQAREALRRSYAEAGYNLVNGSFETGGTLASTTDVLLLESTGVAYAWTGAYPVGGYDVAPGVDPTVAPGFALKSLAALRDELSASVASKASTITPDIFAFISGVSGRHVVYAEEYGVVNSSSIDSSDALQLLVNENPAATIILPTGFALSKSIKYPSYCDIRGTTTASCVCFLLPGFTSDYGAAFEPMDTSHKGVIQPSISNITIVDLSASNSGKGSTSVLNGVELLGTFRAYTGYLSGVRINNVVHCFAGDGSVTQYTQRPKLEALNGSNINKLFCFDRTSDGSFGYGDIQCCNIYTTGSVRYGASAEDTDGFTWVGSTMFPDAQLKVSGHYLSISVCHPFEAKAKLTEPSNVTSECLVVAARNGGARSAHILISAVSAFAGRLADTTSGSPPQVNKGGAGIALYNTDDFKLDLVVNDPSQQGLKLQSCFSGIFDVVIREANTQRLGSGAEAAFTYDGVLMAGCYAVLGRVVNQSPNCRYAVYMDDSSSGCHVDVVSAVGGVSSSNVRIPANGNCSYELLSGTATGFVKLASAYSKPSLITDTSGSITPSSAAIRHGVTLQFNNSVSTNVTDLPGLGNYDEITIHIQDNGATKLVPVAAGGKFVWQDGSTTSKLGRGTIVRVMRAPTTGYLVQI